MDATTKKAIEALETLPDPVRQSVADYVVQQAEKYLALKAAIQEGLDDEAAGRMGPWDYEDFLKRARARNGL